MRGLEVHLPFNQPIEINAGGPEQNLKKNSLIVSKDYPNVHILGTMFINLSFFRRPMKNTQCLRFLHHIPSHR